MSGFDGLHESLGFLHRHIGINGLIIIPVFNENIEQDTGEAHIETATNGGNHIVIASQSNHTIFKAGRNLPGKGFLIGGNPHAAFMPASIPATMGVSVIRDNGIVGFSRSVHNV